MDKALNASSVDLLESRILNTQWGPWRESLFIYGGCEIVTMSLGDWSPSDQVMCRIHSSCFAAHYLGSVECDCREQLDMTFVRISKAGRGVIVFLDQDGRGNGQVALMRAAQLAKKTGCTQSEAYEALGYPADSRGYMGAGVVLKHLRVGNARLLTHNPSKISALRELDIAVTPEAVIVEASQPAAASFYRHKALEGYLIDSQELSET